MVPRDMFAAWSCSQDMKFAYSLQADQTQTKSQKKKNLPVWFAGCVSDKKKSLLVMRYVLQSYWNSGLYSKMKFSHLPFHQWITMALCNRYCFKSLFNIDLSKWHSRYSLILSSLFLFFLFWRSCNPKTLTESTSHTIVWKGWVMNSLSVFKSRLAHSLTPCSGIFHTRLTSDQINLFY